VKTKNGIELDTDLCILAIGVEAESELAKNAGLKMGVKNTIAVDAQLKTSDSNIFALGDVVQVEDFVSLSS
jgi:pyruvate/2-oxoglutarate dehydrogenase complex dihydrolipoamide dehydrogenase (E3) component